MTVDEAFKAAVEHHRAGRLGDAEFLYRRLLEVAPEHGIANFYLGIILKDRGELEEAVPFFRRALERDPAQAEICCFLGLTLQDLGQKAEAESLFRRALQLKPAMAEAACNLGIVLQENGNVDEAIACYRQALRNNPDLTETYINLSTVYKDQEKLDEARECIAQIIRLRSGTPEQQLWRLRAAGLCPAVFDSVAHIDAFRHDLLRAYESSPPVHLQELLLSLAVHGAQPPFNLLYHGRNNRPLKEAYAKIFHYALPEEARRPYAGKPRVGLVVTHGAIFLRFWQGMLERMTFDRFGVVLFVTQAEAANYRKSLKTDAVEVVVLPGRLDLAMATIRAAQVDVLYHWEVGSSALNYFLPFFRLAPVQCTSGAIQETSGVSQVDYYLSSELIEPAGAQDHYTEKLILGKTMLTYHPRPAPLKILKPRAAFGLRADQHLYLCAQNLRKIHPEFDPLLAEILRRDPSGVVVLVKEGLGHVADKLRHRFARTMADVFDRIVFLPWQAYPDYLNLVSVADVILDPLHYNGGTTTYECLGLSKPVVTWPGPFQISRAVLALYRKMGIKGCVANTADEYIRLAVALGTDAEYRQAVAKEIAGASGEIFEDIEAVREHEALFERLVEEARSGIP